MYITEKKGQMESHISRQTLGSLLIKQRRLRRLRIRRLKNEFVFLLQISRINQLFFKSIRNVQDLCNFVSPRQVKMAL